MDPAVAGVNMQPLFELIKKETPMPTGDPELPLQMQNQYPGLRRLRGPNGIGRISNGAMSFGQLISLCKRDGISPAD